MQATNPDIGARKVQRVNPGWSLALPLLALTALVIAPVEMRLYSTLLGAILYTMMQYLVPECRLRRDNPYSPLNLVMVLFLTKLVFVPMLMMLDRPTLGVLAEIPSLSSMEWASLVEVFAFLPFCFGLAYASRGQMGPGSNALFAGLSTVPRRKLVIAFGALGLLGFVLVFQTPTRLLEYLLNPQLNAIISHELEGTFSGVVGTFLRPFLAVALAAMWARQVDADHSTHGKWKRVSVGIVAAIGILIANLTFDFNRAAFVFPLVALLAVYSSRVRRVSIVFTLVVAGLVLPALISLSTYRASTLRGEEMYASRDALKASLEDVSEHIQAYVGGPMMSGFFYDKTGWGSRLLGGSTLISSILSPVPMLGKGFRDSNGPALFNRAIYGNAGFEDQIIPFESELFVNLHLLGVVLGFWGVGLLMGTIQRWLDHTTSTFGAFALQYVGMWSAMLSVWSLSVYSQILIYFCGPFYVYVAIHWLTSWIRSMNRSKMPAPFLQQKAI